MAEPIGFYVDIVSAEGSIHAGKARMCYASAEMGEVGIAPRHAPLLTRLRPGSVRVETPEGSEAHYFVSGGILEVQPQQVTILADTAVRAADLDEAAAERARNEAEEALSRGGEKVDIEQAEEQLVEAQARLQVIRQLRGTSR
ncbi:MAG: F0F1 ATP synthase subunit epsilon [Salinisphaera sp.]|nr:F0F1 ATP synthase subunit epsilon [Salinisphaera sp.]MDN5937106.1 F0F1 ATP synthase subunit epsilon [Salinisphaera sp.]